MALNFLVEPFFDDYSEDKNFYRVMFRPGYAVQARELTQMQTILQEQIRRHGDHIFKQGSMVIPGQISHDLNVSYVTLDDSDPSAVDKLTEEFLKTLVGNVVQTSNGLSALVITYTLQETVGGFIEKPAIYVKYLNTVDSGGVDVKTFAPNDILSVRAPDAAEGTFLNGTLKVLDGVTGNNESPTGLASIATIEKGIYYINKHFIINSAQTIVLDKYSGAPTCRVGLEMVETFVYPEEDESLLDNSLGSPNYSAPGAARYSIELVLKKLDLDAQVDDANFIDLMRMRDGRVLFKIDRTQYAEIEKTLARRTYDESGDYTLRPFGIEVREYRNNNRGEWAASEKYIQGDVIKKDRTISGGVINSDFWVAVTSGTSSSSNSPQFNIEVVGGEYTDNTVTWRYIPIPEFNRGVHTFTSGDSKYSNFTVNDHTRLSGMMAVGVEPSKAYVRGYEIEKIATEYLPVEKSRDLPAGSTHLSSYLGLGGAALPAKQTSLSSVKTTNIDVSMGSYVIANNLLWPMAADSSTVELYDVTMNGTWAASGASTVTVTKTGHGLTNGNTYQLNFTATSGTNATSGAYAITVTDVNTFTVTNSGGDITGSGTVLVPPGSVNKIGEARVRGIDYHATGEYKVFLFDIVMNSGKNFSSIKSIYANGADNKFRCNVSLTNGEAVLISPERSSLIYQLPDYAIKEIQDISYIVLYRDVASPVAGVITLPPPIAEGDKTFSFESTADKLDNFIVVNNVTGSYVDLNGLTFTPSGANVDISGFGGNTDEHVIFAAVKVNATTSAAFYASAAYKTDGVKNVSAAAELTAPKIELLAYVTRISSIMMDDGTAGTPNYTINITSRYSLEFNQNSSSIGVSYLTLAPGYSPPSAAIQIKYEYIDVNEVADGFEVLAVGSYTASASKMTYEQIPSVGSLQLRDSIDMRPIGAGGAYATKYFPKFGTTMTVDYRHYLPRVDNISLSSSGSYIVNSGIPSLSALEPSTPQDSMKLARLVIEPYTFGTSQSSVTVDRVENKRYTMRDIGKLERRIEDLEYYTTLTMLEMETKNTDVIDSLGLDRLKNGFIVDAFDGQGVGNTQSPEWSASVDSTRRELRPFFAQKQLELLENVNFSSRNYKVSGDIVSLPYTETLLLEQDKASRVENVNPYALHTYTGIMTLNPWSDTWFSTERRPDVIINDEGEYNAVVSMAEEAGVLGSVWNSWQTVFSSTRSLGSRLENLGAWSVANTQILNDGNNGGSFWRARQSFTTEELNFIGITDGNLRGGQAQAAAGSRVLTIETSAVETTSTRTGVRSFIVDRVDSRVLEDRVVETKIIPFIRSRAVLFTGFGFKPSTRMYAFFDGVDVGRYVTPAVRLKVSTITNYPNTFDVERNAGSAVQNPPRLVLTEGTTVGEVEIAFNHGEVITEYDDNNQATGKTAIVIGQEIVGTSRYIYVMNIKGGSFTINNQYYLKGEYPVGSDPTNVPRVRLTGIDGAYSSEAAGAALRSSQTGFVGGIFRIPNNPIDKFRTGTREFKLTDSASNTRTSETTRGISLYEANGLIEVMQRTILSTRKAEIVQEQISDERTVVNVSDRLTRDTGWFDPLAQTFMVQQDGGAFITSVDLYFNSVSQNVPVRVEIREVVNGYPGSRVLPFSRVEKKGSVITTSLDASVATNFKFTSPVYLQNGVEYALVALSDSNDYTIWISRTSEDDVLTGNEISSQPYNGVLFKSQNGTAWTASQTEDMKFRIYRANFTSNSVDIELIPKNIPYRSLGFNPLSFKVGTHKIRVSHRNHGMKNGDKVKLVNRQVVDGTAYPIVPSVLASGTEYAVGDQFVYNGNWYYVNTAYTANSDIHVGDATNLGTASTVANLVVNAIFDIDNLTVATSTLDSYVIESPIITVSAKNIRATGYSDTAAGGAFISASENYKFQTAMIDVSEVTVPGTSVSYAIETSNNVYEDIIVKENKNFNESLYIPSTVNATAHKPSIKATLRTNNSGLSPIIDLGRMAITLIDNRADSPTISNTVDLERDVNVLVDEAESTEIGTGKEIEKLSGENTLKILSSAPGSTALLNALNRAVIGNILRITYSNLDDNLSRNIIVTNKYIQDTSLFIEYELYPGSSNVSDTAVSATCGIKVYDNIIDEVANGTGTVSSKYVTKKINLARQSNLLRIMFAAVIPQEAEVEIYYKTSLNAAGNFDVLGYTKAAQNNSYTKSEDSFVDVSYTIEDLQAFDAMQVKIVMKTTNPAKVPRIKDFRVIACA